MTLLGPGPQGVNVALTWSVCAVDCDFATIQRGVAAARDGDTLVIAAGNYEENVVVDKALTLRGAGRNHTIVDGRGAGSVIAVTATAVTLEGITVRNGWATQGGGIRNSGDLTVHRTIITGNGAYPAGRAAGCGGGIYNTGTLTLTHSTVSDNGTPGCWGGGIFNGGHLSTAYSTFRGNWAYRGGGSYSESGSLSLTNCTVSGNTATAGGGIFSDGGVTIIQNSTVADNWAGSGASGIESLQAVTFTHSIVVAGPSGQSCRGSFISQGYNLDSDNSCQLTAVGDISAADANLGPLQDNGGPTWTHALLAASPAIDAGDPDAPAADGSAPAATDQRGYHRFVDGNGDGRPVCDIGAYEMPSERILATIATGSREALVLLTVVD